MPPKVSRKVLISEPNAVIPAIATTATSAMMTRIRGKDLIFVMLEISKWSDQHLCDRLKIPEDRRALLEMDPEHVARIVRARLAQWEEEFLPEP